MNKKQKAIELFKQVQSIPFYCLGERDPEKMIEKNKASCSEKHLFLGRKLEKIGIPVKYLLIEFNWSETPVPKEIIAKKDSLIGYHLALKASIEGKWLIIDASWDEKLEKAGFPVTKDWKGDKDTKLAVKPLKIIELEEAPPEQIERTENREFYNALNEWLEEQREI